MPLTWDIIHDEKLVRLKIAGALRFSDVTAYLEGVSAGGAIGYRKLCDARDGYSDMTERELTHISVLSPATRGSRPSARRPWC